MLTLQFIPFSQIASLPAEERLKVLLEYVKEDKIVLLEGRLRPEEEAELIKKTMEHISEKFSGIELGHIEPMGKDASLYDNIRRVLVNLLMGGRTGFTIVGPANVIKDIKHDPNKIQLYTQDKSKDAKKK